MHPLFGMTYAAMGMQLATMQTCWGLAMFAWSSGPMKERK